VNAQAKMREFLHNEI
jgi:serine/threonine protein kinase